MMKKAAIIIASGFEEGETLTIADIIKRAHLQCDLPMTSNYRRLIVRDK